jgi:hypothetical protein
LFPPFPKVGQYGSLSLDHSAADRRCPCFRP